MIWALPASRGVAVEPVMRPLVVARPANPLAKDIGQHRQIEASDVVIEARGRGAVERHGPAARAGHRIGGDSKLPNREHTVCEAGGDVCPFESNVSNVGGDQRRGRVDGVVGEFGRARQKISHR